MFDRSEFMKKRWAEDKEYCHKMTQLAIDKNPNRNGHFSHRKGTSLEEEYGEEKAKEIRAACGIRNKDRTPWNKNLTKADPRVAKGVQKRRENGNYEWSDESRKKSSKTGKQLWSDPEYRDSQIHAQASGRGHVCPSSYEIKIIDLCNKYSFPFIFVGNWSLIIDGFCPDFIHHDRQLLIETYCAFWHEENYEENRYNKFSQHGYETLFLSDNDLNADDWEKICFNKIQEFTHA